jgi:hypothetical protein
MSDRIYTVFVGAPPMNLPPDVKIRYAGQALAAFVLFFCGFLTLFAVMLWHPLPVFGDVPAESFRSHWLAWFQTFIFLVTAGNAFQSDIHSYWEATGTLPFGMVEGRFLCASITAFLVSGWIFLLSLTPREQFIHVKGAILKNGKDSVLEMARMTREGGKDIFMYLHPDLGLPKKAWTRHTLIYGSVGSGKTQILLGILKQIFDKNIKAIIYDIKGDFTAKFSKAILVSPWDQRSAIWDIARDIDTDSATRSFANSLYPTKPGDKNSFFSQAAAAILIALVKSLYNDFGGKWGWAELDQRISLPQNKLLHYMVKFNPSQASVIEDEKSQSTSSVLGTFANGALVINQLAQAWGGKGDEQRPRLSLKKWLRDDYKGVRQIILQGGKDTSLQAAYIAAMINSLVPEIISPALPDDELGRSLFFIIDEFPTIGKIAIQNIIALARSKGGMAILGYQAISQVKEIYGDDFAKALPAMVGTQIVCQLGPGETRHSVAQLIGKRRVAVIQNNYSHGGGQHSVSSSYHETERELMSEQELTTSLGTSKRWEGVRSLYMSGDKTLVLDFPFITMKDERPSFVEASWCRSLIREENETPPCVTERQQGASSMTSSASLLNPQYKQKQERIAEPTLEGQARVQSLVQNDTQSIQKNGAVLSKDSEAQPLPIENMKEDEPMQVIFHPGDPEYLMALELAVPPMYDDGGDETKELGKHLVENLAEQVAGPIGGEIVHGLELLEELEESISLVPVKGRKPPRIELIPPNMD